MRALRGSHSLKGQHLVIVQFDAYQDGALTEAETAAYRQHLASCRECQKWVDNQIRLAGQLRNEAPAPAKLSSAAAARVEQGLSSRLRRSLIVNKVTTAVGSVAAVAVLVAIIGTFIWQYRGLNPAGEPLVTEVATGAGNLAENIPDGDGEAGAATTPVQPSPKPAESVTPTDAPLTPTDTPPAATEAPPSAAMPFSTGSIRPGQQKAFSFQASSGDEITFWLHLPEEYDESQAWPLILSLHGFLGFEPSLERVLEQSPVGYVRPDVEFPFIVIAPQAADGPWAIYHEPMEELIAFLGESISIDPDAQFLTGLSAGAVGAWQWALTFPDRFAGMAINSGTPSLNPNDPVPKDICLLKDLPIWIALSDADQHVLPMEPNRQVVMALEECGSTVINLTVYSDLSHAEAISTAYEGPELYEWMLALRD